MRILPGKTICFIFLFFLTSPSFGKSCAKLFTESSFIKNFDFLNQQTTQPALEDHNKIAKKYLQLMGIEYEFMNHAFLISPLKTGNVLNRFAHKIEEKFGVPLIYNPGRLAMTGSSAFVDMDKDALSFEFFGLSFESILFGDLTHFEIHEWAHLLRGRYFYKHKSTGSILNAQLFAHERNRNIFLSPYYLLGFDEIEAHLVEVSMNFHVLTKAGRDFENIFEQTYKDLVMIRNMASDFHQAFRVFKESFEDRKSGFSFKKENLKSEDFKIEIVNSERNPVLKLTLRDPQKDSILISRNPFMGELNDLKNKDVLQEFLNDFELQIDEILLLTKKIDKALTKKPKNISQLGKQIRKLQLLLKNQIKFDQSL